MNGVFFCVYVSFFPDDDNNCLLCVHASRAVNDEIMQQQLVVC